MSLTDINTLCANAYTSLGIKKIPVDASAAEWFHQEILKAECRQTLDEFSTVLKKNSAASEEITPQLRDDIIDFLKTRDARVTRSAIGYTAEPDSIANQFCKTLAEKYLIGSATSRPNKALCSMLMPSLEIIGINNPFLYAWSDALDDFPAYGTFLLSDDLLSGKPGTLISYEQTVAMSKNSYLFVHLFYSPAKAMTLPPQRKTTLLLKAMQLSNTSVLSNNEKIRLRHFSSPGKVFFEHQDARIISLIHTTTIRFQITRLISGFRLGGAHGRHGGTEFNASSFAMEALALFFEYWHALPEEAKTALSGCTAAGSNKTLASILHTLSNPGSVFFNTATCVEINASLLQGILDNSDNNTLLDRIHRSLTSKEGLENSYSDAVKTTQGKDKIPQHPEHFISAFIHNIEKPSRCVELMPILAGQQKELVLVMRKFGERVSSLTRTEQEITLYNALYQLENDQRTLLIKTNIACMKTWHFTIERLGKTLNLLESAAISHMGEVLDNKHLFPSAEILINFLQTLSANQAEAIYQRFPESIAHSVNNVKDLGKLINHITFPHTYLRICQSFHERGLLKRLINSVTAFKTLFNAISAQHKKDELFQIFIQTLESHAITFTTKDLIDILSILNASQCEWFSAKYLEKLFPLMKNPSDFHAVMTRLPLEKRAVICKGDEPFMITLIESIHHAETFSSVFHFLSETQRSQAYAHSKQHILTLLLSGSIKRAENFYHVMYHLNTEERTEIYLHLKQGYFHDYFRSMMYSVRGFSKALSVLTPDQRTEAYAMLKNEHDTLIAKINTTQELIEFLVVIPIAFVNTTCKSLNENNCIFKHAVSEVDFRNMMYRLDPERRTIVYEHFKSRLPDIIKSSDCFRDIFSLVGEPHNTGAYHLFSTTQIKAMIKKPEDFETLQRFMTPEEKLALFVSYQDAILLIFATSQSLDVLASDQRMKQHLIDLVQNRFVPIYNLLRAEQSGIWKSDFIHSDAFQHATGFQQVRCVWEHIAQRPTSRSMDALRLALTSHELNSATMADLVLQKIVIPSSRFNRQSTLVSYNTIVATAGIADPRLMSIRQTLSEMHKKRLNTLY